MMVGRAHPTFFAIGFDVEQPPPAVPGQAGALAPQIF
jgi:hypothetical protein